VAGGGNPTKWHAPKLVNQQENLRLQSYGLNSFGGEQPQPPADPRCGGKTRTPSPPLPLGAGPSDGSTGLHPAAPLPAVHRPGSSTLRLRWRPTALKHGGLWLETVSVTGEKI